MTHGSFQGGRFSTTQTKEIYNNLGIFEWVES